MDDVIEHFENTAISYAQEIKNKHSNSPFGYMVATAGNFFTYLLTVSYYIEEDHIDASYKEPFLNNLSKLTDDQIKKIFRIFLMEYFAFAEFYMKPRFKTTFAVDFEELKQYFTDHLELSSSDKKLFQKIYDNYDSAYHSRLILKHLGFPKNNDDSFLIETIEEIKPTIFHQINRRLPEFSSSLKS